MRRIILYASILLLAGIAAWMFSLATPWLGSTARAGDEADHGWTSPIDEGVRYRNLIVKPSP